MSQCKFMIVEDGEGTEIFPTEMLKVDEFLEWFVADEKDVTITDSDGLIDALYDYHDVKKEESE